MTRIPASEARLQFADVINKVAFGGERFVLHRHGKDVAAIVPVEDLQLLENLEDRMDLELARAALKEKAPRIAWTRLKQELGLTD
ncbi:MAG: type II toxin-antitoxin system Phd/YefM family antitoxin [Gemmatimonadaceae bacterium]|nr:type II toxin-antitoxin system Phd/YefM family antitoxin [Gemmatimonadaceae bacterium]MBA3752831.1 type II toxin-antitoxin system Phd/YefM family antitoxin [Nitrospira sp.]